MKPRKSNGVEASGAPTLSASTLQALSEFLLDLHGCNSKAELRQTVLQGLPMVIDSDSTTYNELNPSAGHASIAAAPWDDIHLKAMAIFPHFWEEHPHIRYNRVHGVGTSSKISDFVSAREFRSTGLYNEVMKLIGYEDQLVATLVYEPDEVVGVGIGRHRWGFQEEDRIALDLLQPHLQNAFHRISKLEETPPASVWASEVLAGEGRGVISLSESLTPIDISAEAARLMVRYFKGWKKSSRLPDALRHWAAERIALLGSGRGLGEALSPLTVTSSDGTLSIDLMVRRGFPGCALVLAGRHLPGAEECVLALQGFGLSVRLSQVLLWIAEGKTNSEIAQILGLSPKTVQHHVTRILETLGVENRTSAATLASTKLAHR